MEYFAVPEKIHTPLTKGIVISCGWGGGSVRQNNLRNI